MFNIIKAKDFEPYSSSMRWHRCDVTIENGTIELSADIPAYVGAATPAEIFGPAIFYEDNYEEFRVPNMFVSEVKIIPDMATLATVENKALYTGNINISINFSLDNNVSAFQLSPSMSYAPNKFSI